MRKITFSTVMAFMFAASMFSQGNSGLGFNYQAIVRGADGFVLPKQSVELRFSLLPGQTATAASWVETHNVTTDAVGTIGITVGKGTKVSGTATAFKDINFAAVYYWLKVEIKEGSSYRELSYTQLTSVPYAEVATNAIGVPAGTLVAFAGDVDKIPAGWLLCDGKEINRSEYANLYNAIGTAWGHGNNATTFNLPDGRGQFLRGVANGSSNDPDRSTRLPLKDGGNSGDKVGSTQGDELKTHKHNNKVYTGQENSTNAANTYPAGSNYSNGASRGLRNTGSNQENSIEIVATGGTETRPKNIYVNYIIKY